MLCYGYLVLKGQCSKKSLCLWPDNSVPVHHTDRYIQPLTLYLSLRSLSATLNRRVIYSEWVLSCSYLYSLLMWSEFAFKSFGRRGLHPNTHHRDSQGLESQDDGPRRPKQTTLTLTHTHTYTHSAVNRSDQWGGRSLSTLDQSVQK